MTDRLGIGGNLPPKDKAFAMTLDEIHSAAGDFLDGAAIETEGQANAIAQCVSRARQIRKDAETARKEEKEPHLEAGRAVDAKWKSITNRADDIVTAANKPMSVWLAKIEADQRAEAERLEKEAQERRQAVIQAERDSLGNLEATEALRTLNKGADKADKDAKRAAKAKPNVATEGRAIGLRSRQVAVVTDRRVLLEHVMKTDPSALTEWLAEYACKALPSVLPGVEVKTERKAS